MRRWRRGAIRLSQDSRHQGYGGPAAALAAVERARDFGWAPFATPRLTAELKGCGAEITALDVAALDEATAGVGAAIVLTPAVPARAEWRLVATVAVDGRCRSPPAGRR